MGGFLLYQKSKSCQPKGKAKADFSTDSQETVPFLWCPRGNLGATKAASHILSLVRTALQGPPSGPLSHLIFFSVPSNPSCCELLRMWPRCRRSWRLCAPCWKRLLRTPCSPWSRSRWGAPGQSLPSELCRLLSLSVPSPHSVVSCLLNKCLVRAYSMSSTAPSRGYGEEQDKTLGQGKGGVLRRVGRVNGGEGGSRHL